MKSNIIQFFKDIHSPLYVIVTLFGLVSLVSAGSFFESGDWLLLWKKIPFFIWISVGILFSIWMGISLNRWRINQIKLIGRDPPPMIIVIRPYCNVGELEHRGAIWITQHPNDVQEIDPDLIKVDLHPRCPKCRTELIEHQNLLGYFIWDCVHCGYNKWGLYSFGKVRDDVKKIMKRHFENKKNT